MRLTEGMPRDSGSGRASVASHNVKWQATHDMPQLSPVLVICLAQVLFISADLLAKIGLRDYGFTVGLAASAHFWASNLLRVGAVALQLWLLSQQPLGKVLTLMFLAGVIAANLISFLLLSETLSVREYAGVALAVLAFLLLAF